MLFPTFTFWTFFAILAALYAALHKRLEWQNAVLLVASYVFYGWWDWRFLFLIGFTTVLDYTAARRIAASPDRRVRRAWLLTSLGLNLGLLAVFKYLGFAAAQVSALLQAIGYQGPVWVPHIILPVGISFYTFQSLSYTLDVYRGQTQPAKTLRDYALFVSFFPQLVAGPIERSHHLLGQVVNPRPRLNEERFREGLYYLLAGLFRKVVVADNLGLIAQGVFSRPPTDLSAWEVLIGVYAFAFQIYGDFCGYSTMAQGVARWLGFELMDNFRQPYFATSPQEFWHRWHISLSTWLRDYLFIPLGGSRGGLATTCRNLMITMVLGGIWHGANWTFVAWGAFHGSWLIIHRLWSRRHPATGIANIPKRGWSLKAAVEMAGTFHLVCVGWLFFRADSIEQAWALLSRFTVNWHWTPFASYGFSLGAFFMVPLLAFEIWVERRGDLLALTKVHWLPRTLVYLFVLLALIYFAPDRPSEFIYFQF